MTKQIARPQSPQRFFLNAPKQKDGECYVLNWDYMELDAYCVHLLRERDERAQWAETWHRGLEAVATILDVPSCGDPPMLLRDISAAIEKLRQPRECVTCRIVPVNGKCICNTPGWDSNGRPL